MQIYEINRFATSNENKKAIKLMMAFSNKNLKTKYYLFLKQANCFFVSFFKFITVANLLKLSTTRK